MIVEVVTDEGVCGFGEAMCHGTQIPEPSRIIVDTVFKPLLIGQDPFDAAVLWERMYHAVQPFARRGLGMNAISGVDVALWDCMGRALNMPIYKLMGGAFRTSLHPYATGFFRVAGGKYPEDAVAEARRHVANGYDAMKIKIGYGPEDDTRVIGAVREAVGPDVRIMVDGNCAYSLGTARRVLSMLEEAGVYWFEEPLAPDDRAGYEALHNLGGVLIVMGETEFGPVGFREWIEHRAVDMIQPDVCFSGGFTGCRAIVSMAHAARIPSVPHIWGSGIALAASMQFLATIPNTPTTHQPVEPMLEYDQSEHPFRQALIGNAINREPSGMVNILDGPGLGVTINRDVLREFSR
jgi:D-galactarolactone cycloisomerase